MAARAGARSSGDGGSAGASSTAAPPISRTASGSGPTPSQSGLPPPSQEFPLLRASLERQGRTRSRGRSRSRPPISSTPVDWNSLFKNQETSEDLQLTFVKPVINNGVKLAKYEDGDSADLLKTWSTALVGYVIGMHLSYSPLRAYIKSRWGTSAFELHLLQNEFFICKFDSQEEMRKALEGFWTIRGHPMLLRKWTPDIRMELDSLKTVPLWVSFVNLPLHLWTKEFIGKLCSVLGQPLYLDKMTAERKRLAYARACVLVSSDEDLPDSVNYFDADGSVKHVKVSYQWRPRRCSACKLFGHADGACKPKEMKHKGHNHGQNQQVYMPKSIQPKPPEVIVANQFAVLADEQPDAAEEGEFMSDAGLLKAHVVQKDSDQSETTQTQSLNPGDSLIDSLNYSSRPLMEAFQVGSLPSLKGGKKDSNSNCGMEGSPKTHAQQRKSKQVDPPKFPHLVQQGTLDVHISSRGDLPIKSFDHILQVDPVSSINDTVLSLHGEGSNGGKALEGIQINSSGFTREEGPLVRPISHAIDLISGGSSKDQPNSMYVRDSHASGADGSAGSTPMHADHARHKGKHANQGPLICEICQDQLII